MERNLYLVHGWKVGEKDRNTVLFMKGEEARNLKVTLTMSRNGNESFVGRLLGSVSVRDGEDYVGVLAPTILESEKLKLDVRELGLEFINEPLLYMVAA